MISLSRAVPVNPPDASIQLTRDDVWRGLELKARDALPFVKSMNRCEVVESDANTLLRNIEINGEPFQERVTLTPKAHVEFVRTKGRILGTITNDIEEDADGELLLRFGFNLEVEGVESGSAQEREIEDTMKSGYLEAVDATLAAVRRLVTEGDSRIAADA